MCIIGWKQEREGMNYDAWNKFEHHAQSQTIENAATSQDRTLNRACQKLKSLEIIQNLSLQEFNRFSHAVLTKTIARSENKQVIPVRSSTLSITRIDKRETIAIITCIICLIEI